MKSFPCHWVDLCTSSPLLLGVIQLVFGELNLCLGSGSTYIYGFCDAEYKDGMTRDECISFVSRAISHAMARDGSSGGTIRLAIIDEAGVQRVFIPGNKLPKHYEL